MELIASAIAAQMPTAGVRIVTQLPCEIRDGGRITNGVCSRDFSEGGKRFVSFRRLLDLTGQDYEMKESVAENWENVRAVLQNFVNVNAEEYLVVMSLLDYLVGNEDRHLNNFGLLSDGRTFFQAPLFDFGLGLFEHDRCYEGEPFRKCLSLMQCKPFSSDNQRVIDFLREQSLLDGYVPEELDLTDTVIPSPKAGSYLRNRCRNLGITLKGVD